MIGLPTRRARQLGGVAGIVAALAIVPAYTAGTPDLPETPEEAAAYYKAAEFFVTVNGILPLLHAVAFLIFLGVLVALLRATSNAAQWASIAALGGGLTYVTVSAVGVAAEILYPVTVSKFPEAATATEWPLFMLMFSAWLFHFTHIGAAVMMIGTAVVAFTTDVLPRWFAWVSVLFAVIAALHGLGGVTPVLGLVIGLATTFWIALTACMLFVVGRGADSAPAAAHAG